MPVTRRSIDYWEKRAVERQKTYENVLAEYENRLRYDYKQAFTNIETDIQTIVGNYRKYTSQRFGVYLSMSDAQEFLNSAMNPELYQDLLTAWQGRGIDITDMLNRTGNYTSRITNKQVIRSTINQEMNRLGKNEVEFDKLAFRDVIQNVGDRTLYDVSRGTGLDLSMNRLNSDDIDAIMSTRWSGEMFSQRVWNNTSVLGDRMKSVFTLQQLSNRPTSELMKELVDLSDVGQYACSRLIRTEANAMRSLTEQKVSKDLGLKKYRIIATLDMRTSEVCQEKDLTIGEWEGAEVGIDIPPFHPNCRSIAVDYFENEDYSKLERIAKDPVTGKTTYIPGNMTYDQWMKRPGMPNKPNITKPKVAKSAPVTPTTVTPNKRKIDRDVEIKQINDKHSNFQFSVTNKSDFNVVLNDMTPEQLNMYNKLSDNFSRNTYTYRRSGAAYYPGERSVKMSLDSYAYEKKIGYSRQSALSTKLHEEFHQLDHILFETDFGKLDPNLVRQNPTMWQPPRAFTDIRTPYGAKMISAIDQDIIAFMNEAIDLSNANSQAGMYPHPKVTNLVRLSKDDILSTMSHLLTNYNDQKTRAQISMFTDAVGLSTGGRISPYANGFWGHDNSYNKQRGKNGATSETWANFGAAFFTDNEETKTVIKKIMPKTWTTMTEILSEIIDYALDHEIKYK